MSEAQKRSWFSHAGFWGTVVAMVLGCAMLGYSAPPTKLILPAATIGGLPFQSPNALSVASSADGSIMVVGEPSPLSADAGVAYVYVEPSGHKGWGGTLPTPVTLSNPDSTAEFGTSVAISSDGSRIIVGDPDSNTSSGAVWVFDEPTGGWGGSVTDSAELSNSNASQLGASVAISNDGNTVVSGATYTVFDPSSANYISNAGAGFVFTYTPPVGNASGSWDGGTDLAGLSGYPTPSSNDQAGVSVAIVGNGTSAWAFVGAPYSASYNGTVFAFQNSSTGWAYVREFQGSSSSEQFGFSVAAAEVAGTTTPTLVVGAPRYGATITDLGRAFVYQYNGSSWTSAAIFTSLLQNYNNQFGYSVALDRGDTRLIIGSLPSSSGATLVPGRIYQYDEPSKGKTLLGWSSSLSPTDIFTNTSASTISPDDYFGAPVAVGFTGRDTWVLGGALLVPAAYIFEGK